MSKNLGNSDSKNARKPSKVRKKDIFIGVTLIGIALFGTFGVFEILKLSLNTDIPLVVVTSDSMVPEIYTGDLLVVKGIPAADIKNGTAENKEGDIIIYDAKGVWPDAYLPDDNQPVVHRVIDKKFENGTWYFKTKGDNNLCADPPYCREVLWIPEDHILGVVQTIIPKVGYVKIYLTNSGLAIPLIVILGVLLVISIVWDITHPEEEKDEKKRALEKIVKSEKDPSNVMKKPDLGV